MRRNKYEYLFVIQGNYGYGWDDEYFTNTFSEAKRTIKEYRENLCCPFRIIRRRCANPAYSANS